MTVYTKLINIQAELKAPKSQRNSHMGYKYRNAEDILEAVKPLLLKHKATLFISDDIVFVEGRYYVKAVATFIDIETGESVQASALAREEDMKKGLDSSQVTGSTSSYARKYALNGLFLIDDTKDSDYSGSSDEDESNKPTYTNNNSDLSYGDKTRDIILTDKQLNYLNSLCAKKNTNKEKAIMAYNQKFNKNISLTNLTREDFDTLLSLLK